VPGLRTSRMWQHLRCQLWRPVRSLTSSPYKRMRWRNQMIIFEHSRVQWLKKSQARNHSSIGPDHQRTLYQYHICPYCNKVKALFDFFNIPYKAIEVNPSSKAELKAVSPDYTKVPVVFFGKQYLKGSDIIAADLLQSLKANMTTSVDMEKFDSADAQKWAMWASDELAVLLFPNISRTYGESFQAFSYVHNVPHFTLVNRISNQFLGAFAMWAFARKKIKKKYGIEDERDALSTALDAWVKEACNSDHPFHGGDAPNVADIAVFGCIRSIEGLRTFDMVMEHDGAIRAWYSRVAVEVGKSACVHYD